MAIKTRFLLLSDTHARAPRASTSTSYACRWPLPPANVAIHTGDLTMTGTIAEHESAVDMLKRLPADLKIVIPGNHDLTLDREYYAGKGDLHGPRPQYNDDQLQYIRDLYTGADALAANIAYIEEGRRTFQLGNGARLTIYASAYTPEFCDWAFAYPREQDRYNTPDAADRVPDFEPTLHTGRPPNIDVVLTHGPPYDVLDKIDHDQSHVGCEHLFQAVARSRPLLHCFGHIHEGWGVERNTWITASDIKEIDGPRDLFAHRRSVVCDTQKAVDNMGTYVDCMDIERGRETVFVNSSIMDVTYKPVQGPFVIDMMLDEATAT